MRKFLSAIVFVFSVFSAFSLHAQQFRGMELGAGTNSQDVADMRALLGNVNFVRLALIVPGADEMTLAEYEAGLAVELARADEILAALPQYNMQAYVAMHTPPGGFRDRTFPAQHNLFSDQQWQTAVVRIWGEIAARYKDNPAVAGYDALNEPAERNVAPGLKNWVGLYGDIVAQIRANDPVKRICLQPKYGNITFLKTNNITTGYNDICYSFHLYFPNSFINQGLNGGSINKKYKKSQKQRLKKLLNKVKKFQKKAKKVLNYTPAIYLGEFSVVRWAPENDAVRYLRDVTKLADKRKWDWSYQAWRGSHEWDVERTSDINSLELASGITPRAEVLKDAFTSNP